MSSHRPYIYKEEFMLYKEALAASGYSVIKTEELEQLRAQKVSLEMLLAETVEVSGSEYESRIKQLQTALEKAQKCLDASNENLISMVSQYCAITVKKDETSLTFSHDFMSAGEEAFEYLVNCGLAEWCENGVDIHNLKWLSSKGE